MQAYLQQESRIVDYKLQPASLQDLQSAFYQSARIGNYQTAILLNCRDWKLPNCYPAKLCLSAWRPTRGRRITYKTSLKADKEVGGGWGKGAKGEDPHTKTHEKPLKPLYCRTKPGPLAPGGQRAVPPRIHEEMGKIHAKLHSNSTESTQKAPQRLHEVTEPLSRALSEHGSHGQG